MSHALVKAWGPSGGTGSASAVTLTGGPIGTNGNGVWVLVQYQQSSARTISTVKDQSGNALSYRSAGTIDGEGTFYAGSYLLWVYNLSTSVTSIVVTLSSASSAGVQAEGWEFSGLSTIDPGASFGSALKATATTAADNISSGNITAGSQPGLLFGVSLDASTDGAPNAGTGFTDRSTAVLTGAFGTYTWRAESKDIASTGTLAATFTNAGASGNTCQAIAGYVIDQAPAVTLSSAGVSSNTDVSVTGTVTQSAGGGTLYAAVTSSNVQPVQNGDGHFSGAAVVSTASQAGVSGANSITVTGLTASTNYWIWYSNNNGANSNVPVSVAFTTTAPAPSVTSVSSTTPSKGSSLTITGTNFGSSTGSVTIGGTAQTVTAWSNTSITVTVGRGTNKYGVAVGLSVTSGDTGLSSATYNGITGLTPQSGWSYVNLGTPNATSSYRITAISDLASGDQLAWDNKGGLVTVLSDATFSADATVTSFDVEANDGTGWGATATQTLIGGTSVGKVVFVSNTICPANYAPLARGIMNARDDTDTSALLQWHDFIHTSSARLYPKTGLVSAWNTLIAATQKFNPNAKFFGYSIAYEDGGQIRPIGTLSLSGSTLTLNTVSMSDANTAVAPDSSTASGTVLIVGLTGGLAVYNGEWPGAANGATSVTCTVSGAALSGPASGDAGGNAIIVSKATVAYDHINKLKDNPDWWLYKRGTSGRKVAWSSSYETYLMNLTKTATLDGSGNRWIDWKATYDNTNLFSQVALQGVFIDNFMDLRTDVINDTGYGSGTTARNTYDVEHDGSGQDVRTDPALTDHRQGCANYAYNFTKLGLLTMGNHDSANGTTLGGPMAGSLDHAFIENVFSGFSDANRATNLAGASGFSKYYNPAGANGSIQSFAGKLRTSSGKVILGVESVSWTDLETLRFAIGMCWLHDIAVPMMAGQSGTRVVMDEFRVGAGASVDPIQTAAYSGTLWKRAYQNMLVLVNAGGSSASIDLTGTSWKRINGATDPTVNSGGAAINGSFSVPAWSARILVKSDPGL